MANVVIVIGFNTFCRLPQIIVTYLDLHNPSLFTSHCLRKTSATMLTNTGADFVQIKKYGSCKSPIVAQRYVDELTTPLITATRILTSVSISICDKMLRFEKVMTLSPLIFHKTDFSTLGQQILTIQN